MVIGIPICVQFFVERNELVEERFALGIRVKLRVFGEQAETEVKLTHTVNDVEVFDIESLYVFGEGVVVGTLAGLEISSWVRVLVAELGSGCHYFINLLLYGVDLFMRFDGTASFEELAELALDEFGLALGIDAEITIHYRVVGELEKEERGGVPIALVVGSGEELGDLFCEFVHCCWDL